MRCRRRRLGVISDESPSDVSISGVGSRFNQIRGRLLLPLSVAQRMADLTTIVQPTLRCFRP